MKEKIRYLPLEKRMELYEKAMALRKKYGWGYVRIGRELSIPIDVVRHWLHHGRNPIRQGKPYFFEEKASPELAYIIGVCYGDADLPKYPKPRERSGYRIRLRAKDRDFVEKFTSNIAILLGKNKQNTIGFEKGQYRIILHSYYLHKFLKRPLDDMKPFVESYPAEFIKGLTDSEGSAKVSISKWDRWRWLSLGISITSSNLELLRYTRKLLNRHFKIGSIIKPNHKAGSSFWKDGKKFIRNKDAYELIIGKLDDVRLFSYSIGFSITRKQQKLIDAVDILENHNKGPDRVAAWLKLYKKENNRWIRIDNPINTY